MWNEGSVIILRHPLYMGWERFGNDSLVLIHNILRNFTGFRNNFDKRIKTLIDFNKCFDLSIA